MLNIKQRAMSTIELYGITSLINYINWYQTGEQSDLVVGANAIPIMNHLHIDENYIAFFHDQGLTPQYAFIDENDQAFIRCYNEDTNEEDSLWWVEAIQFTQITEYKILNDRN